MRKLLAVFFIVSINASCTINNHSDFEEKAEEVLKKYYDAKDFREIETQLNNLIEMHTLFSTDRSQKHFYRTLMMSYIRLFYIEDFRGNKSKSDYYYYKAIYWFIIESESSGLSINEIMEKEKVLTRERCKELVHLMDIQLVDKLKGLIKRKNNLHKNQ